MNRRDYRQCDGEKDIVRCDRLSGALLSISVSSPRCAAGVLVPIEAREVTARDFNANLVPGFEEIARFPEYDLVRVDSVGFDQRWCFIRLTESRPHNAFADVNCLPSLPLLAGG